MSRGRVCISPVGQRNRETNGALSLCFHHTYNASPSTLNTKQPSSAASRLKQSLPVEDLKQSWQDQCQSYVPCLLKVRRSWDTSRLTSQRVTTVRQNCNCEARNTDPAARKKKKPSGLLNNSQSTPKTLKRFPRVVLPHAHLNPHITHTKTQLRNPLHACCPRKYTEWSVRWRKET